MRAQRAVMGGSRPDLAAAADDQKAAAEAIKTLAPGLRSRPSLLGPLWGAAGAAAGAVAGVAPRSFADAIRSEFQNKTLESLPQRTAVPGSKGMIPFSSGGRGRGCCAAQHCGSTPSDVSCGST